MKTKNLSAAIFAALSLSLTSCGGGIGSVLNAQNTTSTQTTSGLGNLAGGIGQALTGLLSGALIPTESQIVGTWVYQSPAVVFNSDNVLANLGGTVASSGIETKLQTYLAKYGIVAGSTSITFNKDMTFTANIKGNAISGKYTINGQSIQMTFNGMAQPSNMTPQLNNGSLIIAGDATKLMSFVQGLGAGSQNSQLSTISNLMKQFNGMQLGIRLQKQ